MSDIDDETPYDKQLLSEAHYTPPIMALVGAMDAAEVKIPNR